MTLFGFEIIVRRKKAPTRPTPRDTQQPVTIDEWIAHLPHPEVTFRLPYSPSDKERVVCDLSCHNQANWCRHQGATGKTPLEALNNAILELDKTIGVEWRRKLVAAPEETRKLQ